MSTFLQFLEQQWSSNGSLFSMVTLFFTAFWIKWLLSTTTCMKKLPPSPRRLPIVGNLHQLGLYPHRSLLSMAQKHGPLMLLHLGSRQTLVVSSAEAASEIMKTHDINFSNRPHSNVSKKLLYDGKDLSVAPYGDYWRQMKSICVLQLLSNKRVQSLRAVREEETALLTNKIAESSSAVIDLTDLLMTLTNDIVCRAALGKKYSRGESGKKFQELIRELVEYLGRFDVGTFIPWLAWIDKVNGFNAKVDRVAREMDGFLEGVVQEHFDRLSRGRKVDGREDFVDVLLGIYKDDKMDGFSIDRDSIKALILDLFGGGTDTTSTALEWAMAELLRHPRVMKELQNEVRATARGRFVSEDDLENMHYLKAVIKESLRLHPPIPLLVPRESSQDVKIMGYDIAAGTMVINNAWAIGRDTACWDEPEEFKPERFLNSSVDFQGHHFQLIPFGAGRRGCPGIYFAMITNELVLANLVHRFDWELPNGVKGEDLDMTECTGFTIRKKDPLLALAIPCPS